MPMEHHYHITHNKTETLDLAKEFAATLIGGDVVALYGDLGAGKTEFVRGICEYFQVVDIVSSPTFTIINSYEGVMPPEEDELKLYHLDLYRINSEKELQEIGFDECLAAQDSIKLVEWADKANGSLPRKRYSVIFTLDDNEEDVRKIEIRRTEANDSDEAVMISAGDKIT
jgi:tRNA threonylcarbamoyladenosine biosynthesis protein TsaE